MTDSSRQPTRPPELSDTPVYNTKAVSLRTGIPADTFRAWERRYGVPNPYRTEGSHRLYSERDIASIQWLKQRTDMGLSIRQAVALLRAGQDQPVQASPEPSSVQETSDQLFNALVGLETPQAERLLAGAFARYGVEMTCLHVIQPVMYRVGEEWAAGNVPVSVEHFSSYFTRSKLSGLIGTYGETGTLGPVITACAPGEQHEMGIMMLALFLMRRGVRVIHLGADMPIEDLVSFVHRTHARVVCLSASTLEKAEVLLDSVKQLDRLNGTRPYVSCGGYAFKSHPELRAQFESLPLGADASDAADAIHTLLNGTHPAAVIGQHLAHPVQEQL